MENNETKTIEQVMRDRDECVLFMQAALNSFVENNPFIKFDVDYITESRMLSNDREVIVKREIKINIIV